VQRRYERNRREWERGRREGRWPRILPFRTHLICLGDLLVIGMPAELFYDTGADLARMLPAQRVLTVSQAGGDMGYLPRRFAYRRGTYETVSAPQWYRTLGAPLPEMEARVRRAIVARARRLLRE
jgi:hypothetical protein